MTTLPLPRAADPRSLRPFGDVIEASDAVRHFTINGGNTERYHDLADIDPGEGGRVIVSIFRGQPRSLPFRVGMMERHPLGSQAFVPMSGRPYLVVVAPAARRPTPATCAASWPGATRASITPPASGITPAGPRGRV
jgi:ureidoglycolate lyase